MINDKPTVIEKRSLIDVLNQTEKGNTKQKQTLKNDNLWNIPHTER